MDWGRRPAAGHGFLLGLLLFCLIGQARAQQPGSLRLGIMPFNTPLALMRVHQPLREHLQARLRIPVEIQTSPDFRRYVDDVLAGRFDLVILAPHFAVLAFEDAGYQPIVHYRNTLEPLLVVRRDSDIRRPADLRGRKVAVASALALVSIVGLQRLAQEGAAYPRSVGVEERGNHGSAIAAVAVGEADAALTVVTTLRQMPEDVQARLRTIDLGISLPHLVTMAHPRLSEARVRKIRAALESFQETAAGRRFFAETAYGGYDDFDSKDVERLLPYAAVARQMLREGRAP